MLKLIKNNFILLRNQLFQVRQNRQNNNIKPGIYPSNFDVS